MYLAFYKAKGNFIDYLIRKRTKSKYSHVELVLELDSQNNMLCMSSKPGVGVRCDLIHLNKMNGIYMNLMSVYFHQKVMLLISI